MVVVKSTWTTHVEPLAELAYFADSLNQEAFAIFNDTGSEIEPFLLAELQDYPPVPPNSTYQRTFRLRDRWMVTLSGSGNVFRFEVSNDTDYAVWVVGSLAMVQAAAARFQRDFHREHGWQLATDTVTFWFQTFLEEYQARFENELAQFGGFTLKRRARTQL